MTQPGMEQQTVELTAADLLLTVAVVKMPVPVSLKARLVAVLAVLIAALRGRLVLGEVDPSLATATNPANSDDSPVLDAPAWAMYRQRLEAGMASLARLQGKPGPVGASTGVAVKALVKYDVDARQRVIVLHAQGPLDLQATLVAVKYAHLKHITGQLIQQEGALEATGAAGPRVAGTM